MGYFSKNNVTLLISLISFLATFLFAAPYIHEISHTLALNYYGCPYSLPKFTLSLLNGLEGSVKILCPLPLENYPLVLLAGSLSTFILGNILYLAVFISYWKKDFIHLPTAFIAFGFVFSSLLYFFEEGEFDLFFLVQGYGINPALMPVIGTPLVIAYAYITYRFMDLYIEREVDAELWAGSSAIASD